MFKTEINIKWLWIPGAVVKPESMTVPIVRMFSASHHQKSLRSTSLCDFRTATTNDLDGFCNISLFKWVGGTCKRIFGWRSSRTSTTDNLQNNELARSRWFTTGLHLETVKKNYRRLLQGSSITIIISSIIIVIIVVSDLPVLFESGMFIPPFSKRPASIRCVLKSFVPVHRKTKKKPENFINL